MKLTLRQMQIFLNVVVSGHLTNVAKDMNLSQSAVSMSIKELENILGRPVFDRINKKLVLNEVGRAFYQEIDPIFKKLADIEYEFKKLILLSLLSTNDLNYKNTTYHSNTAYYQSKHLLTSFTYYLSRQLKETGITVNCIHPGFVKTALAQSDYPFPMKVIVPIVGFFIGESPEQAADTPVWLALSNDVKGVNGEYIHHRKIKKSWAPTKDEKAQSKLYNVTLTMLDKWL